MATNFTSNSISAIDINNIKYHIKSVPFHATDADWQADFDSSVYIPKQGEIIVYDADLVYDYERIKIGDGTTTAINLPFWHEEAEFISESDIENIINSTGSSSIPGSTHESEDYPGCYYRLVGEEREWLNPPMALGVEYRTTERYNGEPLYVRLVDCGYLLNNDIKQVIININHEQAKGISAVAYSNTGTLLALPSASISVWVNNSYAIALKSIADFTTYRAYVTVKYIKN